MKRADEAEPRMIGRYVIKYLLLSILFALIAVIGFGMAIWSITLLIGGMSS